MIPRIVLLSVLTFFAQQALFAEQPDGKVPSEESVAGLPPPLMDRSLSVRAFGKPRAGRGTWLVSRAAWAAGILATA